MNVDRAELAAALGRAASHTGKTIEAVQHIRMETRDGFLYVTATNLETGVDLTVEAKGTLKPILVPSNIARMVAGLNSERVDVKATKERVSVEGNATFRLPLQDLDNWPDITLPTENEYIPEEGFHKRYMAVHAASSTDGGRPILNTVKLGTLVAATDSYRLATFDLAWAGDDILVPSALTLKQPVDRITWDRRNVAFHTPDGVQWGRLVEGTFPSGVDKMIAPAKNSVVVTLDAESLADVCGQASLVGSDADGLQMTADGDGVAFKLLSSRGDFEATLPAKVDGELESPVAFNPNYLKGLLAVDGEITMHVEDSLKAVQLSNDWWKAAIMPIRVKAEA